MWKKEGSIPPTPRSSATSSCPQSPVCQRDPVSPVSPVSPSSVTMCLPRCLLLLASLIPPALGSWGVSYPESLQASGGSCLVVPCTFSYPTDVTTADGIVAIWYKDYDGQRTLVFHSTTPQDVDPRFGGRAQLLGDPMARNCTLLLRGVTPGDSGLYRFRFEIINGDRWSASRDVTLSVSEDLESPSVTSSEEQTEGQRSTLQCSTPYVCPGGDIVLRWEGYDPRVSEVSGRIQLDTSGVSHQVNLTSSFSWKDHSKKLLCEVSDGSKRASTEVVLRVRHTPKDTRVSLSPSSGNIGVGDTVTLSCEVGSSHPPVSGYHWYKDGVAVGTERVLALRGVRRQDHGRYRCEAQNVLGIGVSPDVTLRVFSAEISASPAAEVREGTATTLSCDVPGREGHPDELTYTWYKNSAWLKEGPAHTLLFPAVTTGDAGYYSCQVTNSQGSDTAQAISLSVTYPPRIPTLTLFQETQGGRLVIIRCTVDSHPPATLAIDRDGTVLATSGAQVALRQRLGVTASRNSLRLEIRDAGPQDSGKYGCTASNVHGNASATKVLVPRAAGLLIQPSAEVTEGTAVTLTCVGTGDTAEKPLYTWYRNGRRLQDTSFPTLEFPSVRGDDAGAFQCQVRSRNSSDTSETVPLRVFYPPRQPVLSSFLQSQGGHLGIIQCSVGSDPESNLTLRRGNDVIACSQGCPQATSPRVRVTRSYNSLKVEIRDVVVEDEGIYVCQAGNSQGNSSATVDFKADTANVTVSPSPHVLEGDNATLTCHLSSGSTAVPKVTWYHNGQQVTGGSATSLLLWPVASRDTGLYRCQASTAGSSRSSPDILLDVLCADHHIFLPSRAAARVWIRPSPDVREGDAATLTCAVSGGDQDVLRYTWYRNQVWLATSSSQNLTLPVVTASDAGSYQCSIQTPARNHSAIPATLSVLYPPRNLRLQSFVESSQGTATILLCAVDSHPPAQLTLLRGGHPLASSPPGGGDTPRQSIRVSPSPNALRLEFREASEEDEGEYECQARSALGDTRASLTLRVQATKVLVRPSAEVPEGTEVTLTCQAPHAQPGTLYTWFKNGRWVTEGPEPSLGLRGHRSDAGLYGCRAGRGPLAAPAALSVLYAPQEPSFAALLEPRGGRRAVLLCSADGVPPPDIAVSRGQGHPPLATSRGTSDPRLEVRATPTSLRVAMAGLEPGDAGLYLCSATNSRGSATASLRLEVTGVTLTVEPSQEVPEGTRATMSCEATAWGDKGVNYTWYRDGRWLWEGQSSSFVLSRVSSADAGSYQCQASGTWGTATSAPTSLSVLYPPRAVSVSTFLENRDGRGAIVLCTAESHPPSWLALHHRGHLLATSLSPAATPGLRAVPSHNALRLELVAMGTAAGGRYVCVATNALGNATASADLDVHTLRHLWTYRLLSGLLMAIVAITIVVLLAMKDQEVPELVPCRGHPGAEEQTGPVTDGRSILTWRLLDPRPAVPAGISQSWLDPGTPLGIPQPHSSPSSLPDGFRSPPHMPGTGDSSGLGNPGKIIKSNLRVPGTSCLSPPCSCPFSLRWRGGHKPPVSPWCPA
ncbi:sialoadhesin [Parus major]|uniref:sialoadhesin n=1 Tax=Parus major TaxID=9157 RepID=UPI001444365A|nr:sialoadhesin [Parus major]